MFSCMENILFVPLYCDSQSLTAVVFNMVFISPNLHIHSGANVSLEHAGTDLTVYTCVVCVISVIYERL